MFYVLALQNMAMSSSRGTCVSFHAQINSSNWKLNTAAAAAPGGGGAITYNSALTNIGNGLDLNSGIFTAPFSGTYYFAWSGESTGGAFVYLKSSAVNGNLCGTYTASSTPSGLKCHAIVSLNKGDTVWAALYNTGYSGIDGNIYEGQWSDGNYYHFTNFMGMLLC